MIKAGPAYDQRNEFEHRDDVARELANKYDKRQDIVIPYGKKLGFNGTAGEQVVLSYDEAFKITIDGSTVVELATDSSVTTLQSEVTAARSGEASLLARVTTVNTTATNAGTAASTAQSEVTAARQGEASLTAKVTALASATSTVDGKLSASYALTVDANGRIASMKLLSNGTTSSVKFIASTFTIYDGASDVAMFEVSGGAAYVAGSRVRTDSIIDTAVSVTSAVFSASGATTSISVTTTGGDVIISASFQSELGADGGPSDYATHDAEIARGSTVLYASYGPINNAGAGVSALGYSIASWAATAMDSPAAGTYTYSVSAPYNNSNGNTNQMRNVAIVVTELKK